MVINQNTVGLYCKVAELCKILETVRKNINGYKIIQNTVGLYCKIAGLMNLRDC